MTHISSPKPVSLMMMWVVSSQVGSASNSLTQSSLCGTFPNQSFVVKLRSWDSRWHCKANKPTTTNTTPQQLKCHRKFLPSQSYLVSQGQTTSHEICVWRHSSLENIRWELVEPSRIVPKIRWLWWSIYMMMWLVSNPLNLVDNNFN